MIARAPASFTISRVRWVKGVDGDAERDDIELCTRPTLKEAMDAVRSLLAEETYVVDKMPRGDAMFPAYWGKGGPDARAEGEKVSEEVTENRLADLPLPGRAA